MRSISFNSIIFLSFCAASTVVSAFSYNLVSRPSPRCTFIRNTSLKARGQQKKQDPLKSEISDKRKKQLGIVDEREYDLGVALATNTDPLITKIIAGSFILVVIGLLVAGIIVPSLTDYGDGVCNPIKSGGRC